MSKRSASAGRRRKIKMLVAVVVLALVTVSAAIMSDILEFGVRRSDLYNPEREALVEADWQLAQSSPHHDASASPTSPTHRHIVSVLDWLDRAEGVRSDHRKQIAVLRGKVQALAEADRIVQAGMARRDQLYDEISTELKFLIDRYGDSASKR